MIKAMQGREKRAQLPAILWLIVVSASFALAVAVAFFDRTSLSGLSRLWLGSFGFAFAISLVWWTQPRLGSNGLRLAYYPPTSLVIVTLPLVLGAISLAVLAYLSDDFHGYLYHHFHYQRLLSKSYWPVVPIAMATVVFTAVWGLRAFLLELGAGARVGTAVAQVLERLPRLLPLGLVGTGLLLATVSLAMMNVNYWRYWATADGIATTGHYIVTHTDQFQIDKGGVYPYFVSYPLLPTLLFASFGLLGHNAFAAYLPIILGSALLPLALFLAIQEVTGRRVLAFLFACVGSTFPLLRAYTLDVGEADSLLVSSIVFAAYFRLKADKPGSGRLDALASGLAAGVAALARPEGILYSGAMFATGLKAGWRRGCYWLSVLTWLGIAAVFSAVTQRDLGMLWPGNHSSTIKLSNFTETLQVIQWAGVFRHYADAMMISESVLAAIGVLCFLLVGLSSIQMLRKDLRLIYMPAAALGNVAMVFLVGPVPAEAAKYHDFFRHVSYGFPLLAITLAYGAGTLVGTFKGRWKRDLEAVLCGALALTIMAQLAILEAPIRPFDTVRNSLMSSDVRVTAASLLTDPYPLETMRFKQESRFLLPDNDEYLRAYPDNINSYYAHADIRQYDNPADYYAGARTLILYFLLICAGPSIAAIVRHGTSPRGRSQPAPSRSTDDAGTLTAR